ncbi:MAG: alpha-galactosidase [Clostridia bacterium]|nr:alpha-galactosidase [Clostridia bacterium]
MNDRIPVTYDAERGTFTLRTANTAYQMAVTEYGHLLHLYYGETLPDNDVSYLIPRVIRSHESNPPEAGTDRTYSLCAYPQEFSSNDAGDYRIPSIELVNGDGSYAFVGKYVRHRIYDGKYSLDGMPSLFANDGKDGENVRTLEIDLEDSVTHVGVTLLYGVFFDKDVITRSVIVRNGGDSGIRLQRIMSASIDFTAGDLDMIEFFGHHYVERQTDRKRVTHGISEIGSFRGSSGHFHNPFAILCDPDTTEERGGAYGFALMYSGNFVFDAELDGYGQTRAAMGIHPKQFEFLLEPGDTFTAPEVVMAYSGEGLGKLSRIYHDIFRGNVCPSKFVGQDRPVLINSWEPFRFTFDTQKLLETARISKELGADMFVLDDGWFGDRDSERAGLGDWTVNEKKLPGGINTLADSIHELGMKFGLWFEPEMVNEDSDLYRSHPDWCLRVPGRAPSRSRHQLCLDLSRDDVCDHLIRTVNAILDSGKIDYVKWDYNRYVCDVYSTAYPPSRQGEIYHRYILGLYKILDGIISTHPDILFEGCSGGGGRYDGAMLAYFPQIWCSDNTDAPARLTIQYGTSFAYPVCTMGAHVSVCPNKRTKRTVPLKTRALVAMHGTFGYELDPAVMTKEEREECAEYTQFFREHASLIRTGDYYRLASPYDDRLYTAWQFTSKDGDESLVCAVTTDVSTNDKVSYVKPRGLDKNAFYTVRHIAFGNDKNDKEYTEERLLSGAALMNIGIMLPLSAPQYSSFLLFLSRKKKA